MWERTCPITRGRTTGCLGSRRSSHQEAHPAGISDKAPGKDGRVYVYLDLTQDMYHPESQVHRDPLVEELRDRVAFLERALERRSVEAERYQQIVAGLTQTNNQLAGRLREIEAPRTSSEAAESVVEEQDRAEPRSPTGGAQEGAEPRPWWRKVLGV